MTFDPNTPHAQPDLSQADEYVCDRCGYPFFTTVMMVKKISSDLSPSGQAMHVPQPVFKCDDCSYINRSQFGLQEE